MAIAGELMAKAGGVTSLLANRSSVPSFKLTNRVGIGGNRRDLRRPRVTCGKLYPLGASCKYIILNLKPSMRIEIKIVLDFSPVVLRKTSLVVQWGHCNLNYGSGNKTRMNFRYTACCK
jgi:hypothetical protein